jgi:hypothetical protein
MIMESIELLSALHLISTPRAADGIEQNQELCRFFGRKHPQDGNAPNQIPLIENLS